MFAFRSIEWFKMSSHNCGKIKGFNFFFQPYLVKIYTVFADLKLELYDWASLKTYFLPGHPESLVKSILLVS